MVTVIYFPDATKDSCDTIEVDRLADFLSEGFTPEELIDMRFFERDIFGKEIDTSDGSFIDIDQGTVVVIRQSTVPQGAVIAWATANIVALLVGATVLVATILLTPKPEVPDTSSRKQQSATNSLGKASNEPRINQRIDDVFGMVGKHTPPLWQVPYRIGVNNKETEIMLLCVGRGKYEIDTRKIYDGDTQFTRIPNAKVNIYEPGSHPGKGTPVITAGGIIDQPIGIYREPGELSASELVPPNDVTESPASWSITSSTVGGSYNVTIVATDAAEKEIDLTALYDVGDSVTLRDFVRWVPKGSVTLWWDMYQDISGSKFVSETLATGEPWKLDGTYVCTLVKSDRLSFTTTNSDWAGMSTVSPMKNKYYRLTNSHPTDSSANLFVWSLTEPPDFSRGIRYYYPRPANGNHPESSRVISTTLVHQPTVGSITTSYVGPVFVGKKNTKVLINLTSNSGFYKLVSNAEKRISAEVEVLIESLNDQGVVTGTQKQTLSYKTNEGNITSPVYQTYELSLKTENDVQISLRRTTNRDKSSGVGNVDKIEWSSMYMFEPISADHDFGDVTLMHTSVTANPQSLLVKDRVINLDVTRKLTLWDSKGEVIGEPESHPSYEFNDILIHTALDPKIGGLSLKHINALGFTSVRNQIVEYYGNTDTDMIRFGYDFDDTQTTYDEMFTMIANVVNCVPYVQNGKYDIFFERPQKSSTLQITHRNKIPDSESREDIFENKYDGVELTYRNKDTGVNETIYVPSDRSSINPERIEFPGCTLELQAYRRALRIYNKQRYHMFNCEFSVDEFGRMVVPGQRIDSPDSTRFVRHHDNTDGYRVYDGEVVEVKGLVVELSEPVLFTEGEDHYIQFTSETGQNSELILCTEGTDKFKVVLSALPVDGIYDGYERDKTKFTFCSEQLRESIALIPQTIEFTYKDGKETNVISSINYHPGYYEGDMEKPE